MNEILETERLILRSVYKNDAKKLVEFYTLERKFFEPWFPKFAEEFYTESYQERLVNHFIDLRAAGSEFRFYIFKKDSAERIIGNVSVSNIVRGIFQSAFLGYSVSENENGKGFATESLARIIEFCFNELKLHRLEANIIPSNLSSVRVAEKLNFIKEGYSENYLFINNRWEDHLRYAIVNNHFK